MVVINKVPTNPCFPITVNFFLYEFLIVGQTVTLTLGEEREGLKMFDSGHPGNVFVPKQDEVTGG
jgi:hypothetical protein